MTNCSTCSSTFEGKLTSNILLLHDHSATDISSERFAATWNPQSLMHKASVCQVSEAFKNTVAKENNNCCCWDELWVTRREQISTNDIWPTFKSLLSGNGPKYESFIACVNFGQVGPCCLLLAFEFIRFWGTLNGIKIRFLLTGFLLTGLSDHYDFVFKKYDISRRTLVKSLTCYFSSPTADVIRSF